MSRPRVGLGMTNCASPARWPTGLREAGLDEADAWAVTDLVRVLLALPRPSGLRGAARTADARLIDQWLARDLVRTAIGLNTWQGVEYLDRDRFETMLRWAVRLDAIEAQVAPNAPTPRPTKARSKPDLIARLGAQAETAEYRVDRLLALLAPAAGREAPAGREASDPRTEGWLTVRSTLSPGPADGTRSTCPPATRTRDVP